MSDSFGEIFERIKTEIITAYEAGHARGRLVERERLTANIQRRVADLRVCHKNDYCQEMADHIEGYIEEFLKGTNE